LKLASLAAFTLVGYFALYAWLRATDVIVLGGVVYEGATVRYRAILWDNSTTPIERLLNIDSGGEWPRSWSMKAIWPAVKVEVVLDRRKWLPWGGIRKVHMRRWSPYRAWWSDDGD